MYLMQWLMKVVEPCLIFQDRDENMHNPRLAPIIIFAMLCKETYLKGNVTPRPISDGELNVLSKREGHSVRNPTRRQTISLCSATYTGVVVLSDVWLLGLTPSTKG